jgi:hypothetical protein
MHSVLTSGRLWTLAVSRGILSRLSPHGPRWRTRWDILPHNTMMTSLPAVRGAARRHGRVRISVRPAALPLNVGVYGRSDGHGAGGDVPWHCLAGRAGPLRVAQLVKRGTMAKRGRLGSYRLGGDLGMRMHMGSCGRRRGVVCCLCATAWCRRDLGKTFPWPITDEEDGDLVGIKAGLVVHNCRCGGLYRMRVM